MRGQLSSKRQNMTVFEGMRAADDESLNLEGNAARHSLLRGIPDEVTLNQIAPKLLWKEIYTLSSVSPAWRYAIQSGQVYEARVRSQYTETETLVLLNYTRAPNINEIILYSIRDNSCCSLPPVPGLAGLGGIPRWCKCVPLDGKLFVMGGEMASQCDAGNNKVYVLDLARRTRWRQCASMLEPREKFGCGVMNGKIFVFGGEFGDEPVRGSEMYDPKENTWSPIRPMKSLRFDQDVLIVGEELFVYGGKVFDSKFVGDNDVDWAEYLDSEPDLDHLIRDSNLLEAYHPEKDEWRVVQRIWMPEGKVFVVEGEIHSLRAHGIHVYNIDKNSWQLILSNSFAAIGPVESIIIIMPYAILAINDGLLAIVNWCNIARSTGGCSLVQSSGLGSLRDEIVWQRAQISLPWLGFPVSYTDYFIQHVQL